MAKYIGSRKRQNMRKKKPSVGLYVFVNDPTRNVVGQGEITNIIAPNVVEVKMEDGNHYRVYNNQVSANQAKDEEVLSA